MVTSSGLMAQKGKEGKYEHLRGSFLPFNEKWSSYTHQSIKYSTMHSGQIKSIISIVNSQRLSTVVDNPSEVDTLLLK